MPRLLTILARFFKSIRLYRRTPQLVPARAPRSRPGFTLIELLVSITIIGIMSSMVLFAMFSAQESAKKAKTEALIAKLHSIIMQKYDSYRTRRVPVYTGPEVWQDLNGDGIVDGGEFVGWQQTSIVPPQYAVRVPGTAPTTTGITRVAPVTGANAWPTAMPPVIAAKCRLDALRDIMRLELPDRWSDVIDLPNTIIDPWFDGDFNGMSSAPDWYCNQSLSPTPPRLMAVPAKTLAYQRSLSNAFQKKMGSSLPAPPTTPAAVYGYLNTTKTAGSTFSTKYQDAELLYLIVTTGLSDELSARELFGDGNVGDKDGNGLNEFWDAWNNPIRFVRWPAGYASEVMGISGTVTATGTGTAANPSFTIGGGLSATDNAYNGKTIVFSPRPDATFSGGVAIRPDISTEMRGYSCVIGSYTAAGVVTCAAPIQNEAGATVTPQVGDTFVIVDHDPFDGKNVYGWNFNVTAGTSTFRAPSAGPPNPQQQPTYATYPLIFSAGPDQIADIITDANLESPTPALGPGYGIHNNNPFASPSFVTGQRLVGTPWDTNNDGEDNSKDNIHNHLIGAR
jgi:prepilin-type N-terminal cleavage/methylation domain-containing protein